jgi:SAM-dependent methyltransferase
VSGRDWGVYYAHASDTPRDTLLDAASRFERPGLAVDVGCGTGRDTVELLRRGWCVVAIDGEQRAIDGLRERIGDDPRLTTVVAPMEEATWPECNLVNSSFALPFCPPEAFPRVWEQIVVSLRPGGRFAGQLFGVHDEWAGRVVVHSRAEVEALLAGFDAERLDEVEQDGTIVTGAPKHWHVFHVVARRRAS